jgi:hypothetical protein
MSVAFGRDAPRGTPVHHPYSGPDWCKRRTAKTFRRQGNAKQASNVSLDSNENQTPVAPQKAAGIEAFAKRSNHNRPSSAPSNSFNGTIHSVPNRTPLELAMPLCFQALLTPISTTNICQLSGSCGADVIATLARCKARSRPIRGAPRQTTLLARTCKFSPPSMSAVSPVTCVILMSSAFDWVGKGHVRKNKLHTSTAVETARHINADNAMLTHTRLVDPRYHLDDSSLIFST